MNANLGIGVTRIGQIAIRVHDVERAVAFYRDVLGLRYLFQAGGMAFFDCGGVRLMLSAPEKPEFDHPGSVIYFNAPDLPAAYARMREQGVILESEPHLVHRTGTEELWMLFFRDPDGNLLALMNEIRRDQ